MEDNKKTNSNIYGPVLFFYGKASGWIIGSAILAVLLGKYLTNYFGKDFWMIICIVFGFIVSIYGIYREINIYKKSLEKNNGN